MQSLLGGVCYNWLLPVELLLGKIVHNFPHACLTPHADTTEAFALTIGSVLIELDL